MRASTCLVWTVLEACQEEVLTHLSKPWVAFLTTWLLELHEVDACWYRYFRFGDELCPLDVWIFLFDISFSLYFWNDDFFVIRIFLIWIRIAKCFKLCNRHVFPPLKWQDLSHINRALPSNIPLKLRTPRWTPLQHGVSKWLQNSHSETAFALVKPYCCKFDDGLLRCGYLCLEPSAIYPG